MLMLLLFVVFYVVTAPGMMIDDAFISFRYAEHLADGHGLVFNIGEERVEGFSNPLWVAMLALSRRLGLGILGTARVAQFVVALLALPVTAWIFREVVGRERDAWAPAVAASALLATNLSFLALAHTGMETTLFALLIAFGVWRFLVEEEDNRFPWSGVVFGLAALTRPEGFGFALLVGLRMLGLRFVWHKPLGYSLRWMGLFTLVFVPFLVWRLAYFGQIFPNTYYAKVSTSLIHNVRSGLRYCYNFATGYMFPATNYGFSPARWLSLAPIPFVLFRWRDPKRMLLVLLSAGYVCFIVVVGEDWMPYNRFFVHLAPLLAVLSIVGIHDFCDGIYRLLGLRPAVARYLGGAGVIVTLVGSLWVHQSPFNTTVSKGLRQAFIDPSFMGTQVRRVLGDTPYWGETVGAWMKERYPAGSTVSVELAGAVPYYSGFRTLDTYGLNDREIAQVIRHDTRRVLVKTLLARKPELFTLQLRYNKDILSFESRIDQAVVETETFRQWYRLDAVHRVRVDIVNFEEMWLVFYVRRGSPVSSTAAESDPLAPIVVHGLGDHEVYAHDQRFTPY